MEIRNSSVIVSFILLFLVLGITLHNINVFVGKESKCESGFTIIEKCKCIPDEGFAKLSILIILGGLIWVR